MSSNTVSGNGKVSRLISIYLHFLPPVNQLVDAMQLCYKQKLRKVSILLLISPSKIFADVSTFFISK